jgi:heat shock protein HtpX
MFKRWILFAVTNVVVMITIGILARVTGVDRIADANGINYVNLIVLSGLWGFSGSIISLLASKLMAKWSTGAKVIENAQTADELWLIQTVKSLSEKAGIGMPDVAIYDGAPNAFATGAFKNSALVAVSTGLLQAMNREEVEAVLAHEISHVVNGDMITMALMQGVVNSFVVFATQLIRIFMRGRSNNNRGGVSALGWIAEMVAQMALTLLGSLLCAYFSRHREFRADAGAASLRGAGPMIAALNRLGGMTPTPLPGRLKAFGISGGRGSLFATHPPLEERIAALQRLGGR